MRMTFATLIVITVTSFSSALAQDGVAGTAPGSTDQARTSVPSQTAGNQDATAVGATVTQEDADMAFVLAFERVMARAIARSERSVVSIARKTKQSSEEMSPQDRRPDVFGQRQIASPQDDPTDPDFVPNEFATGVVVDRRGLILTNYHVVDPNSDYYVTTFDRKVFYAEVVPKGTSARCDLAILQVKGNVSESNFVPITFGDASTLKKGQIVIALGNPYAIARDGQASASWGIVANVGRKVGSPDMTMDEKPLSHFGTLIQTDAKLNLGTSGGALLNLRGEMVGLTTSLAATAGYEQSAGYAIPVDDVFLRAVENLKRGREVEFGFLGIAPVNFKPDVFRGKHGILVNSASSGTPAHRGGIVEGDIITHVNGRPIHDADGLRLEVGRQPAAAIATISVERNGQPRQFQVTLGKYWINPNNADVVTERAAAWRGMRVDFPTAIVHIPFEILPDKACLAISEVEEESAAWKAGLRRGMLISHVGTTPVDHPEHLHREVAARKAGAVEVRMITPLGETRAVTIEPE